MSKNDEQELGVAITGRVWVESEFTAAQDFWIEHYRSWQKKTPWWAKLMKRVFDVGTWDDYGTRKLTEKAFVEVKLPGATELIQAEIPVYELKQALLSTPDFPRVYGVEHSGRRGFDDTWQQVADLVVLPEGFHHGLGDKVFKTRQEALDALDETFERRKKALEEEHEEAQAKLLRSWRKKVPEKDFLESIG